MAGPWLPGSMSVREDQGREPLVLQTIRAAHVQITVSDEACVDVCCC